ncbi:hypothetical protein [Aliamphritea ceti]|nr:hypothetical protein [Aliamphritea ceti]
MQARDAQQQVVETHTRPTATTGNTQTTSSTDLAINTSDSSVYQLSCD